MSSKAKNDVTDEAPPGDVKTDPDYLSRRGETDVAPVVRDEAPIEDPIDPKTANSDATLEADEKLAVKEAEGDIVEGRTRGATKPEGTYTEPGDEEGLPGPDDGSSNVR